MKLDIIKEVVLTSGVTASLSDSLLKMKGPRGEIQRRFIYPRVEVGIEGNKIIISSKKGTKKEKKIIGSFYSHIKNMVRGVMELHVYKLKICSGHFPMNVSVSGKELIIKNFLGETIPRIVKLPVGAEVKVNGTEIVVSSVDKELSGQVAAKIEKACRITNRDIRVFQDGCYITEKAGKLI